MDFSKTPIEFINYADYDRYGGEKALVQTSRAGTLILNYVASPDS
jgi:hypothetical protein